jgi:hypothetical protein
MKLLIAMSPNVLVWAPAEVEFQELQFYIIRNGVFKNTCFTLDINLSTFGK